MPEKPLNERIGERLEANYNTEVAGVECLMLQPGQSLFDIILPPDSGDREELQSIFNDAMMEKIVKMVQDDPELQEAITKEKPDA